MLILVDPGCTLPRWEIYPIGPIGQILRKDLLTAAECDALQKTSDCTALQENHFSCFPDEKHMEIQEIQEMPLLIPLSCLALNLAARYKYKALNLWDFQKLFPFQHQLDVCI